MINKLKYATVADIGIFDLVFYDESKKQELIEFCRTNGINYIPCKDRKTVYELLGNDFQLCVLDDSFKINPYDRIFDEKTLEKFNNSSHNEVRFITENERIMGVVHIIDYNNEFLQVELYRALFRFESNLRLLLTKCGKKNEDFILWVRAKHKQEKDINSKQHWMKRLDEIDPKDEVKKRKVESEMQEANPFQTFYLRELLRFATTDEIISKRYINIENVSTLRNKVAHSANLTNETTNEEGNLIYNFSKLKAYIELIRSFFTAYDYLLDKIDE